MNYLGDKYGSRSRCNKTIETTAAGATASPSSSSTTSRLVVPSVSTKERGLYDQTLSVLVTELDTQGLWMHRKHEAMGKHFGYIPEAVEHARKYFNKTNRALIQQLKDSEGPFLLGSDFTAADIVYTHCLHWSQAIGWNVKWEQDTTVTAYLQRCMSRPAYSRAKATIKKEEEKQKKEEKLVRKERHDNERSNL